MPGPRYEWIEVRLALSNDALNMMSVPNLWFNLTNSDATASSTSMLSITHGPAMIVVVLFIEIGVGIGSIVFSCEREHKLIEHLVADIVCGFLLDVLNLELTFVACLIEWMHAEVGLKVNSLAP